MKESRGEDGVITANESDSLGPRARASWTHAAGSTESPVQRRLWLPLAENIGGVGAVGHYRGQYSHDQVRVIGPGDRQFVEKAASSSLQGVDKAQRRPSWQPTSLAHLTRITAGHSDAAGSRIAASCHSRRHSEGLSSFSSSSSPAFEDEIAATRHADGSGRGAGGGPACVPGYRHHRRGSSYQLQSSFNQRFDPPISGHLSWAEESRGKDRGCAKGRLQLPDQHSRHSYPSPSSPMTPKSMITLANQRGISGIIDTGSGHQPGVSCWASISPPPTSGIEHYHETDSLPSIPAAEGQGGRYGNPVRSRVIEEGDHNISAHVLSLGARITHWPSHVRPSSSAEAALASTSHSAGRSHGLGSEGWSGGEARPGNMDGGLTPLRQGENRWMEAAHRSSTGPGAHVDMDMDYERELHHTHPSQVATTARRRHCRQLSFPEPTPMPSLSPVEDGVLLPAFGRYASDPGRRSSATRPTLSGVTDSPRSSLPASGLTDAFSTERGQGPADRNGLTMGDQYVTSGRQAGRESDDSSGGGGEAACAGASTAEWESGYRLRRSMLTPTGSHTCMEEGCDARPRFAFKDRTKPAYCAKHRMVGMIDTRHPRCKAEHCSKQPSFGREGDRRASFCAKHKFAGMVNVTSRRCQLPGCLRNPNFGFPGDRRATRCKGHRDTGMMDIVSRRCRDPACTRRPLYNMQGMRPVFCRMHKLPEMIDVISVRCQEPGCARHPSFGYVSDMKARRCARHRLENMEGVKGRRQKFRREGITVATETISSTPCLPRPSSASSLTTSFSSDSTHNAPAEGIGAVPAGVGGGKTTHGAPCVDEGRGLPSSSSGVI